MINYSGLPSRVRRIVKVYDYCIDSVAVMPEQRIGIKLKRGYTFPDKGMTIYTTDMEELILSLKKVIKPSGREIKVALYGFTCPISGVYVPKGSNYIELGGLKISPTCDIGD